MREKQHVQHIINKLDLLQKLKEMGKVLQSAQEGEYCEGPEEALTSAPKVEYCWALHLKYGPQGPSWIQRGQHLTPGENSCSIPLPTAISSSCLSAAYKVHYSSEIKILFCLSSPSTGFDHPGFLIAAHFKNMYLQLPIAIGFTKPLCFKICNVLTFSIK